MTVGTSSDLYHLCVHKRALVHSVFKLLIQTSVCVSLWLGPDHWVGRATVWRKGQLQPLQDWPCLCTDSRTNLTAEGVWKISGICKHLLHTLHCEDHTFLSLSLDPQDLLHDGFGPGIRHQRWETHRSGVTSRGEKTAYLGFWEFLILDIQDFASSRPLQSLRPVRNCCSSIHTTCSVTPKESGVHCVCSVCHSFGRALRLQWRRQEPKCILQCPASERRALDSGRRGHQRPQSCTNFWAAKTAWTRWVKHDGSSCRDRHGSFQ